MFGISTKRLVNMGATLALSAGLTLAASSASALVISAIDGTGRSASADFSVAGGGTQLQVILTNDGADVLNPTQVLTALFFNLNNATLGTAGSSATLTAGSDVLFGSNGGGNVGGEWAYGGGLSGAPGGAAQGISSSGFGLFGGPTFNGPSLDPPTAIDGLNYGITSCADDPTTGNSPVTGGGGNVNPLIQCSVTFLLDAQFGAGFDLSTDLGQVSFQYGTSLTEPNLVSEPQTLAVLGFGLLGLAWLRRRRAVAVA